MVTSTRKIIWPQAPFFSPQHLQKGQRRALVRRGDEERLTTELTLPHSSESHFQQGELGRRRGCPRSHQRPTSERGRRTHSRRTWRGHLTHPPGREWCPLRLPATPSADPTPDRRTQCKHSAPAASPPEVACGGRRATPAQTPIFAPLVRLGRKGEEGQGEGRRGSGLRRGPAACARVRGGEGCPGRPPLPPAYLPGSLRRLAPPAPS